MCARAEEKSNELLAYLQQEKEVLTSVKVGRFSSLYRRMEAIEKGQECPPEDFCPAEDRKEFIESWIKSELDPQELMIEAMVLGAGGSRRKKALDNEDRAVLHERILALQDEVKNLRRLNSNDEQFADWRMAVFGILGRYMELTPQAVAFAKIRFRPRRTSKEDHDQSNQRIYDKALTTAESLLTSAAQVARHVG